jgi:hypothetical protein
MIPMIFNGMDHPARMGPVDLDSLLLGLANVERPVSIITYWATHE